MSEVKQEEAPKLIKQTDIFSEEAQFWFISSICFSLIIYSIVIIFVKKIDRYVKQDFIQMNQEKEIQTSQTDQQYFRSLDEDHLENAQKIQNKCEESILSLFLHQSLYMLFIGLLLICLTAYWFTPNSQTALTCIISFLLGCLVVMINAFMCLKFSINTDGKLMVQAHFNKGGGVIGYSFLVGSILATIGLSILILVLAILFYTSHKIWNVVDNKYEPLTAIMYTQLTHSILGYAVGICFSALFYREAAGQSARGVLAGEEMIGKIYEERIIGLNLGMASIISNTYAVVLVQLMDTLSLISSLLCVFILLSSQADKMISEDKENVLQKGGFYAPMYFFTLSVLLNFFWAFISGGECEDSEISSQSAQRIRLQLILSNSIMIIIFFIFPRYLLPRSFGMGKEGDLFYSKQLFHGDFIWCLILGMILQAFLLFYGEYCTSHYFKPVRSIAKDLKISASRGIISANLWSNYSQYLLIIIFSLILLITYCIAGFYGIALCCLGLISSPIALITANFIAGISSDSYKFTKTAKTYGQIIDRLYKFAWATRNFSISLQIINCGGVFMVNFASIGCLLILTKVTQLYIWSGFTLFGVLYGSSLAYFLRAMSGTAVKYVSEDILSEFRFYEDKPEEERPERNMDKEDKFGYFIASKFSIGIQRITISIITCIASVLILGGLFGGECIIGFVIGLNIVGLHMTVLQMLIGNSLKSAKHFNEIIKDDDKDALYKNNIQDSYAYALTIESVPGSTMISYLLFNTMFVLLGSIAFQHSGRFKEWIEQWVVYIPETSTKWVDISQSATESGIKQSVDYLAGEEVVPAPIIYDDYTQPTADGEAATSFFFLM